MTASIQCPACKEENPAKFRLCGYCGAALQAAAPALPVRELRRTVTLLFSDLKGSTALGERLDAEALHEVKERYFAAMAAQITRHGGKIEKYIGDAIMAVFGLPVAHEDDALRALRAAAGMQAELRAVNADLQARYGVQLGNRTGIHTGDAVNLAARLEQAAPENEIYIGEETYRLVRDAVEVEPVEPLELKGKSDRVPAWRLLSAKGLDGYVRRHDAPLVGRDEELAAIERTLADVRGGRAARLITLIGDAGIGKSRLAFEAMARAGANAHVLRGRCLTYGAAITFWPLRSMLMAAADIRPDDPPGLALEKLHATAGDAAVAERLAVAAGLSVSAFPLHELYWAARKFFESRARARPRVVLFDDIHWAEQALLDLIENLLDTVQDAPMLLLATSRHDLLEQHPQWGERAGALRIVLKPLSDSAAGSVARNLLGATGLPDDVVARIVAAAEGNPLYLEQILSMLVDAGRLKLDGERWVSTGAAADISVPPTIKALLESRLGQLGREERSTIDPAAVVGLEFAEAAVTSLAPTPVKPHVGQHLGALARKRFVRGSTTADGEAVYRFHHQLVRDTVYGSLLKRARATLHVDFVRWADRINAERGRALEFQEILGYHLEQAHNYLRELGPLDDAGREIGRDAAGRLSGAARRSVRRGDKHAALKLFTRAAALAAVDPALRLSLLPELGEVMLDVGRFEEARTVLDEAVARGEEAGNSRVVAAAKINGLALKLHKGDPGKWSEATLEVAMHLIAQLEPLEAHNELAHAWRLVCLAYQMSGKLALFRDSVPKLVHHAQLSGDERMVARSSLGLALSLLYGPTPVPEAIERCEAVLADGLGDRHVVALVMTKLAQLKAMAGDFDAARRDYREARAVLDDLGQGMHAPSTGMDIALVELLAGDPAAAEQALRRDTQALETMGETYFLSTMSALLARAVREQGRDDEALELTRTAERIAANDDVDAQVLWRSVRAPILARQGALDEAESLARAALEQARQTDFVMLLAETLVELAHVLRIAGRDGAQEAMTEALELYRAKGDTVSVGRLLGSV